MIGDSFGQLQGFRLQRNAQDVANYFRAFDNAQQLALAEENARQNDINAALSARRFAADADREAFFRLRDARDFALTSADLKERRDLDRARIAADEKRMSLIDSERKSDNADRAYSNLFKQISAGEIADASILNTLVTGLPADKAKALRAHLANTLGRMRMELDSGANASADAATQGFAVSNPAPPLPDTTKLSRDYFRIMGTEMEQTPDGIREAIAVTDQEPPPAGMFKTWARGGFSLNPLRPAMEVYNYFNPTRTSTDEDLASIEQGLENRDTTLSRNFVKYASGVRDRSIVPNPETLSFSPRESFDVTPDEIKEATDPRVRSYFQLDQPAPRRAKSATSTASSEAGTQTTREQQKQAIASAYKSGEISYAEAAKQLQALGYK